MEQYLAFAESQAQQCIHMIMKDWIVKLDAILTLNGRELLTYAGKVTHAIAEEISKLQLDKLRDRLHRQKIEASLDELEQDIKAAEKIKDSPWFWVARLCHLAC